MITTLIPLPVALPLISAALIALTGKCLGRRFSDTIAIATAAATLCLTIAILHGVWTQPQVYWLGNWWPRSGNVVLGICFAIDGIGASLALLTTLLATAALVFSWKIFVNTENHFQPLMLIFMAAMCGFSYTGDLFNIFVFFELMSVSAFALCGLKTKEPAPLQGAFNFAVVNTVGAFMILIGIALLYAKTGALNFAQVGRSLGSHADALVVVAFLLVVVGYMAKGAIVPFHFWLPDAHAVAPTPVCALFSGIMVELGLYAIARIYATVFATCLSPHQGALRGILLAIATVTALLGGVMCYAEHHLKRLLAFSTISHAGLMLAGIALLVPKALAGFIVYVLSHGLIKASLFLCAGIVLHRLEKIGESHLHGRGRGMWGTATLFILGAWGLSGAAPFGTLWGENLITEASKGVHQNWLRYLFLFVEMITAAAVLRVTFRVFFGWGNPAPTDEASRIEERPETERQRGTAAPALMFVPAAALIALAVCITAIPHLRSIAEDNARLFLNQSSYAQSVLDKVTRIVPTEISRESSSSSLISTSLAGLLALLIALGTVFRDRVGKALAFTKHMELGNTLLRKAQSGHPGDYVAWLTFGTAVLGVLFVWLLR